MKATLFTLAMLVCVSACNRVPSVGPEAESRLPTDSAMIRHENPENRSSTSVGIGME